MKIQLMTVINELFNQKDIYPVETYLDSTSPYSFTDGQTKIKYNYNRRTLIYYFYTKDDIKYTVDISINVDERRGRLDFRTSSKKNSQFTTSYVQNINAFDAIKVFNTIISIIQNLKPDIDTLVAISTKERMMFYIKMVNYFHMNYKIVDDKIEINLNSLNKTI